MDNETKYRIEYWEKHTMQEKNKKETDEMLKYLISDPKHRDIKIYQIELKEITPK